MKKTVIFSVLLALTAINANAQLEVDQNGKVAIGASYPVFRSTLTVGSGSFHWPDTNVGSIGIAGTPVKYDGKINVGVEGIINANSSFTSESNYGTFGLVRVNPNHGRNFGVTGMIDYNNVVQGYGGAGIYGTDLGYYLFYPDNVQGFYAAYFRGTTNLQGQTMAQEIYTPADNNLSENVENVATRGGEGMLDNLLKMNVREFRLRNGQPIDAPKKSENVSDEVRQSYEYMKKDLDKIYSRRHFGLSAQELKEIYPNLVLEAQDGYLYVNYTELVPVRLRAIQELKSELDEVKDNSGSVKRAPVATDNNTAISGGNVLYQNTPNPFKEQTTIHFSLADDAQSASICIFDMTGKMLKNIPVSTGDTSVSLNGWELGEGMFLYTLIVNGKEIDTKRMIITK